MSDVKSRPGVSPKGAAEAPGKRSASAALRAGAPWAAFLAFFVAYPFIWSTPFQQTLGVLMVVYALYATGWNILGGMAGQISLGHATFFGVGAYAQALGARSGLNPWLSLLLGALIAVPIAVAIGYPVFRLKGHYFTIATIATGEIFFLLVLNRAEWGGADGLSIPTQPDSLTAMQWAGRQKWEYHFLGLALLVLALLAVVAMARSRVGFYLQAIRNNQEAASSLGVDITRYKQIALACSAIVVSVAGSFFAQYVLFVDPFSVMSLDISIQITIVAVLGGVLSMWGPIVGAVVFVFLTEYTRIRFGGTGDALNLVIYGGIVMLLAAFEPNGILGVLSRFRRGGRKARS